MSNGHYPICSQKNPPTLSRAYPHPLHITCQKCPPSMINTYTQCPLFYVKTGRSATQHITFSPVSLATGLCQSPTSPPSPGRPTPSTPALHRFHQFEDWTYLPNDIYKSRWWNVKTADGQLGWEYLFAAPLLPWWTMWCSWGFTTRPLSSRLYS